MSQRKLTVGSEYLGRVLRGEAIMLCDGGMGTLIQQAGLSSIHTVPDLLNLTHPDEICALQRQYVEAGSDCITTNTFSSNRLKLEGSGVSVAEVYAAAAKIAREAGAKLVAGDIGPTGALLKPLGEMSFDEAYEIFAEQARAAQDAGCDLIFLETFTDLLEAKAALLACLENTALPVFVTMSFADDGRTVMGTTPQIAAATLSAMGAHAVGLNCSLGPAELAPLAASMAPYARCPRMVQPNAGLPRIDVNGTTVYDVMPQEFCEAMQQILADGAIIVGGCCGTTPAHIAALRTVIDEGNWLHIPASMSEQTSKGTSTGSHTNASSDARRDNTAPIDNSLISERNPQYRPSFVVTSGQQMVELMPGSNNFAMIGERINPTGKPALQEALKSASYDYVVSEAIAQIQAGADILDVNVGVPGLDEPVVLKAVMQKLQSTTTVPHQLDSANPAALEAACRAYNGKPLINSVNGKQQSLEEILPIAARYGASLICLTLDEEGIPPTAEERIAIAKHIISAAQSYGIPLEDLVVDCLVMSAATNQSEVAEILKAVSICKQELGVRTVLGVSNVSFGLPERSVVNASFLTAALAHGLDLPILNPLEPRYQDAVRSFRVLNGQDANCMSYVEYYSTHKGAGSAAGDVALDAASTAPFSDAPTETNGPGDFVSGVERELYAAILSGRKESAASATKELLETHVITEIAGEMLSPALDEVGRLYDEGTYFLPQLMASAEAAKAAFDVIKGAQASMPSSGQQTASTPIIMATVEGDIHDIGKNIVIMLLENYGFTVIDLGKNVAAQAIVDAVREHGSQLVGLSALMTTTVGAMEQTIKLLRQEVPDVAIMVGGAVLTEDYALQIGADYYAVDAQASVRIAQELTE